MWFDCALETTGSHVYTQFPAVKHKRSFFARTLIRLLTRSLASSVDRGWMMVVCIQPTNCSFIHTFIIGIHHKYGKDYVHTCTTIRAMNDAFQWNEPPRNNQFMAEILCREQTGWKWCEFVIHVEEPFYVTQKSVIWQRLISTPKRRCEECYGKSYVSMVSNLYTTHKQIGLSFRCDSLAIVIIEYYGWCQRQSKKKSNNSVWFTK